MSSREEETPKPRYTLKPRITPLPSQTRKADKASGGTPGATPACAAGLANGTSAASSTHRKAASGAAPAPVRAQNEDDDLYDPYSDFHDGTLRPLEFEENPWD